MQFSPVAFLLMNLKKVMSDLKETDFLKYIWSDLFLQERKCDEDKLWNVWMKFSGGFFDQHNSIFVARTFKAFLKCSSTDFTW